jgi:hypothetical protein
MFNAWPFRFSDDKAHILKATPHAGCSVFSPRLFVVVGGGGARHALLSAGYLSVSSTRRLAGERYLGCSYGSCSGRVRVGLRTLARHDHDRENSEEAAILTEPQIAADKTSLMLSAVDSAATHVPTLRNFRLSFSLISFQPFPRSNALS